MHESPITKSALVNSMLFSLFILFIIFFFRYCNKTTKIVFCDVGQGDGTYIRILNRIDMIIDAGPPNNHMLACLGRHMPFWDRSIEYVVISHPQSDHYGGLVEIARRYEIKTLYSFPLPKELTLSSVIPRAGDTFTVLGSRIRFLFPTPVRLRLPVKDDNDLAIVMEFLTPRTRILLTGDVSSSVLNTLTLVPFTGKTIIKIPHHGSRYGISERFLRLAHPTLTVISVGKGNSYGHPSKKLLDLLEALHIPVKRTDRDGDIIVSTN